MIVSGLVRQRLEEPTAQICLAVATVDSNHGANDVGSPRAVISKSLHITLPFFNLILLLLLRRVIGHFWRHRYYVNVSKAGSRSFGLSDHEPLKIDSTVPAHKTAFTHFDWPITIEGFALEMAMAGYNA